MTSKPDNFAQTEPARSSALTLHQARMLQTEVLQGAASDVADDSLDIKALLRIVLRHKWLLLASTLLCLAAAVVKTLTSTPLYQAAITLQIDRPPSRIVAFSRETDPGQEYEDYMALPTQIELLKSRALAERVIDELNLDTSRGLVPQAALAGASAVASAPDAGNGLVGALPSAQSAGSAAERDPSFLGMVQDLKNRTLAGYDQMGKPSVKDQKVLGREAVIGSFMGSVSVTPVKGSRLVRVSVVSADPAKAARVANTMGQAFIAMGMERKMEASSYARTFLEEQIKVSKAKLEESERALNKYAKANSLLTLDEKTNVINMTFTDLSSALSKVEQERVKAEAQYNEMARNPANSAQVLDNKTVQAFKEQKAKLEAEYLVNLGTYKPEFPKMLQLKAQIAELELRIKAETATVLASVKAQYDAAKQQEAQVRARVLETRKEVLVAQDRGVDLGLLKRDLDTNRQIYDNLLQRLKEVGVSSGVATNNISMVDAATVPLFPFKPNLTTNMGIGAAIGLMLGLGFIFLREHLDDSIKHADEVEAQFGLPLLGIIPMVKKAPAGGDISMLTVDDPRGSFAESYRSMRTALQFSTAEGAPRRLMVTSSVKGEGKSTTAVALAVNFAQMGKRVLLIDADMRNPTVHKALELHNDHGLSNFLSGEVSREVLIRQTKVAGLRVMTAGPMPPSPVDLLMGPKLLRMLDKLGEMGYDHVIIDAPPILGIADAIVLGNQVQNIVFAIKAGATKRASIKDALRRLRTAGLLPLGVALTRTTSQHTSYHGYDGYYGYGYGNQAAPGDASLLGRGSA